MVIVARFRHWNAEGTPPTVDHSGRSFWTVTWLVFVISAAVTTVWCTSMSAMGEMPMPGGWTMSMAWMRMPGQTWPGAGATFLGMWSVMMLAMMLPSVAPMLWRYRQAFGRTDRKRTDRLAAIAGVAYFFVWTAFGLAVFPVGVTLAQFEMAEPAVARVVPMAAGTVIAIAGAIQFTAWKSRHLAAWQEAGGHRALPSETRTAWRHGARLALHCGQCCANLMVILLVMGVMDLRVTAAVTAAITVERRATDGARAARVIGAVVVGAGLFMIARAAALV